MPRYRKKPVEIEALLYRADRGNQAEVIEWCGGRRGGGAYELVGIQTLEGTMWASPGDFIIRGIQGEFYPCKPDIFEATYEVAE